MYDPPPGIQQGNKIIPVYVVSFYLVLFDNLLVLLDQYKKISKICFLDYYIKFL